MSLDLRQRQDVRVGDLAARLEDRQQPPLHLGVDLRLRGAVGVFLDLLPQVLVASRRPRRRSPAGAGTSIRSELLERVVELDRGALRRDEVLDDLRLA